MDQKHKNTRTEHKLKQLKSPGLIASCDLCPGNGAGLFSNEKISEGVEKLEKKNKPGSKRYKRANDHTASKSTNVSRARYSPEPAQVSSKLYVK